MEEIKQLLLEYYKNSNLSSLEITFKLENKRMINELGVAINNSLKIAEIETKIKYWEYDNKNINKYQSDNKNNS